MIRIEKMGSRGYVAKCYTSEGMLMEVTFTGLCSDLSKDNMREITHRAVIRAYQLLDGRSQQKGPACYLGE